MDAGPFDVKHLVVGGAIVGVTVVAMFLLKGMLSIGFTISLWILVIAIITTVTVISILALTIMGYLRWGPEGFLFAKARKNGLFVFIDAELGSNNADFILGEKASPKDVVLKDEESGIKVDPSMLDSYAKPMSFKGGLNILIYSYYNFIPQTIGNHAAFKAIKKYYDEQCQELNFLSIKEFIELISDPEHYLERNALIKLNKYFKVSEAKAVVTDDATGEEQIVPVLVKNAEGREVPKYTFVRQFQTTNDKGQVVWIEQDLDLPKMMQLIAKARNDISALPVLGGLIAGTEAFKYNSVAYSSQHLAHVLMLYYTKMIEDLKAKIDVLSYGIAALLILVGGAIFIYVVGMVFGGK